jgi:hypothetical protein
MSVLIHVRLTPLDRELPSLVELRARRQLLSKLAEWIECDAWGDDNEVWLEVDDGEGALGLVEQVLADLALEEAATIELMSAGD